MIFWNVGVYNRANSKYKQKGEINLVTKQGIK